MICTMISQMMAAIPTAATEAPAPDHGDTEDKPAPAPSANKISDTAAATKAPAMTAAQDTPEAEASLWAGNSEAGRAWSVSTGETGECAIWTFPMQGC